MCVRVCAYVCVCVCVCVCVRVCVFDSITFASTGRVGLVGEHHGREIHLLSEVVGVESGDGFASVRVCTVNLHGVRWSRLLLGRCTTTAGLGDDHSFRAIVGLSRRHGTKTCTPLARRLFR